jgi:N-acyl homoserine lactone hydrolase
MTPLLGILIMLLFSVVGCGSPTLEPEPEPEPAATLKLYVFDCGHLSFETLTRFSIEDDETDVRELIVPCYIIDHPDGRMLWDGGLPSSYAEANKRPANARLDKTLAEQLAELDLGFDLGSLDYVAFSHMHYDHVGVANEVEGATWLVQEVEHTAMFADPPTMPTARPELYVNLRDADTVLLNGDHDVFGDGRVRILSAPGHTPGHQVMFLDLTETGPLVLSGDLYHFQLSREDRRVPTFNFDAEMTLDSMDRVEAFVNEVGATFWIEHNFELFQNLATAPAYYN